MGEQSNNERRKGMREKKTEENQLTSVADSQGERPEVKRKGDGHRLGPGE